MDALDLYDAAAEGNFALVQMYLDAGVDTESGGGIFEETPLTAAASAGHLAVCEALLAHGAYVDARSPMAENTTPLMHAALYGHRSIVDLLLQHGADPNATDASGGTAAQFALRGAYFDIVDLLRAAGAVMEDGDRSSLYPRPQMVARIRAIPWFTHCGESTPPGFAIPARRVYTWADAAHQASRLGWENATLEALNALTAYLHDRHRAAYNGMWNARARTARAFLEAEISPTVVSALECHEADTRLVQLVQWDLLGAIQEDCYSDCDPPTDFFHQLLRIYENGHFPCGWGGGIWPNGHLVVL